MNLSTFKSLIYSPWDDKITFTWLGGIVIIFQEIQPAHDQYHKNKNH